MSIHLHSEVRLPHTTLLYLSSGEKHKGKVCSSFKNPVQIGQVHRPQRKDNGSAPGFAGPGDSRRYPHGTPQGADRPFPLLGALSLSVLLLQSMRKRVKQKLPTSADTFLRKTVLSKMSTHCISLVIILAHFVPV